VQGPRIYNLFPLLAGRIDQWDKHLDHVAAMGFDWIYVNPIQYPGFSGSLYAIKDDSRLHPVLAPDGGSFDDLVGGMIGKAAARGLKVMIDLVVNHTSKDSVLVDRKPHWYARHPDGSLLSPSVADPEDPQKITEWGDLAEIDYGKAETRAELIAHWRDLSGRYATLGINGFRCDAAYKVPSEIWAGIISPLRSQRPGLIFAAETLGCRMEDIQALRAAGFDLLFNSAKWWDFRSPWLLEQYEAMRHVAPSIAFPESHDTARLFGDVPEGGDAAAYYRLWASFAAFFSFGWMIPMGFEFGFRRRLDVVRTRPENWERQAFDLTGFIADLNRIKRETAALNEEGPLRALAVPPPLVALLRLAKNGDGFALALINPDPGGGVQVRLSDLLDGCGIASDAVEDALVGGRLEGMVSVPPITLRLLRGRLGTGPNAQPLDAARRETTIILDVQPQIDGGRYPVKREVGDVLEVSADLLRHGHDKLAARILYRAQGETEWRETPMHHADNDRWRGSVTLERNCRYEFTVEAWMDAYETWRDEVLKKHAAGQDVGMELIEGRLLLENALPRIRESDRDRLTRLLAALDAAEADQRVELMAATLVRQIMARAQDLSGAALYDKVLAVTVDRVSARFAAWYEIMARSQGQDPSRSATFAECERRLPDIARMGFDVVYLLPIHPIGRLHRKGPDNSLVAGPNDPGSPYAIGSSDGGHTAIHPDLGTLDDFLRFRKKAEELGMEVALDFAIQCAPDHPWIRDHPDWFQFRPDGSIKYAENPPKKYQDIVNITLEGPHADAAWRALRDVVLFWVRQGVRIFRVDNPHTKPVPFWEWMIRDIQDRHPDTIFLAEAFTRPKVMKLLAKVGFTQSYTYFTWRNFKDELQAYMRELAHSDQREYFRPNFFPTTPDILPPFLQTGGRPAFLIRYVLAATLSSVHGIYNGYELCEAAGIPGKEEYLHSEKYQFKVWDWNRPGNIKAEIARINAIRRENPALQEFENIAFHEADDDSVLFFGKMTLDRSNMIFVVVNLDPFDARESTLLFPLPAMGVPEGETFEVEELLSGARHLRRGAAHKVRLDPQTNPVEIYRITVWSSVDYRSPCF
jgi:starch synthase (maltosyl-transferring)